MTACSLLGAAAASVLQAETALKLLMDFQLLTLAMFMHAIWATLLLIIVSHATWELVRMVLSRKVTRIDTVCLHNTIKKR